MENYVFKIFCLIKKVFFVTFVTTVTTITTVTTVTIIIVIYQMILFYSRKDNFFTKVLRPTDRQTNQGIDQLTIRLLELLGAAKKGVPKTIK